MSTFHHVKGFFQAATFIQTHPHKTAHTEGLSYLCGQCEGVGCTGTEAHWCWSEFGNGCIVQAIHTRPLCGFVTRERSHAVPPNQSALTSPHLLERQRERERKKKKTRERDNQAWGLTWYAHVLQFLCACCIFTSGLSRCVFTASMFNEIDSTLHPGKISKKKPPVCFSFYDFIFARS